MTQREILIVEDDGIIAAHIELALRRMGYPTTGVASSGEEALAMAAAHRPDLALMDIGLRGGMDGIATAAQLRERHDVPVVFLTAHTDDATLDRAKATEPAGYLSKPFQEASLKATVTVALHNADLARRVRAAERELRVNEERYRTTFDRAAVGIAHIGRDLRVLRVNPRFCEIMGWAAGELVGKSVLELIYRDDQGLDVAERAEMAQGLRIGHTTEKRFVRKDGAVIWVQVQASLHRDGEGTPEHIIGVFDDITARREAEEKFRLVSEQASFGIAILQDGKRVFANRAYADCEGPALEDGSATPDLERPSSAPPPRPRSALLAEPPPPATGDRRTFQVVTRTGAQKWIERFRRVVLHRGRPAELVMLVDITDRKRAEIALAEKSRHYQLLLQTSRDAIHVVDRGGRLRDYNAAFLEHLGVTAQEARALTVADWDTQWSGQRLSLLLDDLLREPARFETVHRRKDGSLREVELTCAPFEEGGEIYVHASARDVTDRRRAERELRQAREDLTQLNLELEQRVAERTAELSVAVRARDDFLSTMSHELRTPLHAMLCLSESIQEGVYGPVLPKQEAALQRMDERGQHLLGLIGDILDVSKVEAGGMDLDLGVIVVDDVCRAAARLVQDGAARKRQHLTVDVEPGLPAVRADGRRLKQILVNLLGNAIKFTPEEGAVGVSAERREDQVRFTVSDTGPGIAPEDIPRLFRRFGQLDTRLSREHGGAGIGLALVRRLAELHGGQVEVESGLGVGSRFSVSIPVSPREAG